MKLLAIGTPLLLCALSLQAQSSHPSSEMQMSDMPGMNMHQDSSTQKAPEHSLPAPDLLADVLHRPPINLQAFLDAAEKTSPALGEAQAAMRRSEAGSS